MLLVKSSEFLLFLVANGSHKGPIEVVGVSDLMGFFGIMDFILLIIFIESEAACKHQSPLFATSSIYMGMFLSMVFQALSGS